MTSNRRMGPETSATRAALLDAVEAVLGEDGYAALTSRRVAERAGLKQQLLYYYFLTMDDLLLAAFRRSCARVLAPIEAVLAAERPLHGLLKLMSSPARARLSIEYMSLGNHNPAIRAEMTKFGEHVRRLQSDAVAARFHTSPDRSGVCSPLVAVFVMHCVTQILRWETAMGMSAGHEEIRAYLEQLVDELEPGDDVSAQTGSPGTASSRAP